MCEKCCRKKYCKKHSNVNNIYWFGASTEDPGNLKLLEPQLAQNSFSSGINTVSYTHLTLPTILLV